MTIYYVKQDNTVWGCGDPECCGGYFEEIEESFVKCDCEHIEPRSEANMTEHLQSCNGGGPVLKWRKATPKEIIAFNSGKDDGFQEGWNAGEEWQKKRQNDATARLFRPVEQHTVHELIHQGYKVEVDGSMIDKPIAVFYDEKFGGK